MFNAEQLQSQQKILRDAGLYDGPIDGVWSAQCVNSMQGFAFKSPAGNPDGSPFSGTTIPEGWKLLPNGCYKKVQRGTDSQQDDVTNGESGDTTDNESGDTANNEITADSAEIKKPAAPAVPNSFTVTK